jgi:hypothetical protein
MGQEAVSYELQSNQFFRVWSRCETLRDEYMTFLARPGSHLATLVLR